MSKPTHPSPPNMWAIKPDINFRAEIIEINIGESTQKDTFWVVPINQLGGLEHHQTFLANKTDIFPTRETAVAEWISRLEKHHCVIEQELIKWIDLTLPKEGSTAEGAINAMRNWMELSQGVVGEADRRTLCPQA